MNGWFTIEEIDTQTFAISEYQHYEETHCYLLCGQNKAALIDTGLGVSNIKCVVNHLTTLPVTVFTTHVHWDHIGGHKHFGRIAVHEAEKILSVCVHRSLYFGDNTISRNKRKSRENNVILELRERKMLNCRRFFVQSSGNISFREIKVSIFA